MFACRTRGASALSILSIDARDLERCERSTKLCAGHTIPKESIDRIRGKHVPVDALCQVSMGYFVVVGFASSSAAVKSRSHSAFEREK